MEGNQAPVPSSPEPLRAREPHRHAHMGRHTHIHVCTHTCRPSPPMQTTRADSHPPLPTFASCRLVLSPEATGNILFEELRLEAPKATRAFWGGISFSPRAMAVWEEGERRSLHLGDQHATCPDLPPLWTSPPSLRQTLHTLLGTGGLKVPATLLVPSRGQLRG